MFTLKHFIWIGICIIFIVVMLILSKKLKFSLKTASLIMSIICILSEVSKMMSDMQENEYGGMSLSPRSLPFHLCSLMIFVVFYIYLAKDSKLKQTLINFLSVIGTIGSFMAIMIPTNGVLFNEIGPYQCFVFHAGLMWFSIYLLMSKNAKLNLKVYITNISILAVLAFLMIYINGALSAYGTNFFSTGVAGEFSDNHIALLPGEPRALEFKPREAKTSFEDFRKSLSVKHLRATY